MPPMQIEAYVPALPEQVFVYVTAFPVSGEPDVAVLEAKYGRLLSQQENSYTFLDNTPSANRWRCTFTPPRQRVMAAVESTWSDRTDTFEPEGDGTRWTLTWQPQARGLPALVKELVFRLRGRKQVYARIIQPALDEFERQKRDYY